MKKVTAKQLIEHIDLYVDEITEVENEDGSTTIEYEPMDDHQVIINGRRVDAIVVEQDGKWRTTEVQIIYNDCKHAPAVWKGFSRHKLTVEVYELVQRV